MKKKKGALLLSVFFCGSGQFFIYKQRMKGAALFLSQALILIIELMSGYWLEYAQGLIPDFSMDDFLQKESGDWLR